MKDLTQQALQKINLVGKLLNATFNTGKLSDGRNYERVNLTVRVTQTYNNREETSEIPVSMFAAEYTNSGGLNPGWKSIQDLKCCATVQEAGLADAATVRFTGVSLRENAFITRQGMLIDGWQLNASFASEVKMSDVASFNMDIFIMDMRPEIDRDGDETGRLIVKGGIVQYGGKLDVIEFIVEAPESVDYIERNWNPNDTVNVRGRIRVTSIEEKTSGSDSSWGEDVPDTTTRFVRELIITKGDDEGKEEEFAYDPMEIKKGFNVRKANLEQLQIDAKNKVTSKPATTQPIASKYSWE